jgi:phage baseplate assembly protein V
MNLKTIEHFFNKITIKLNSIFDRGTITLIDDTKKIQSAQAKFNGDEILDGLERFQEYGFTSKPHPGAEGIAVFPGGKRSNGIVIKVDDRRYRLKGLEDGEVAIFTDEGDKIVLKRGNKIEVTTHEYIVNASTKIKFTTPLFEVEAANSNYTGKITAQLDIESKAKVLAAAGVYAAGYNPYVAGVPNVVKGKLTVIAEGASPGDIEAAGNVKDTAGTMAQIRTIYNSHTHPENNVMGSTNAPNQAM